MNTFLTSDSGAVTVDWVVLTAALVGLGLATMAVVSQGVEDTSGDIDTQLSSKIVTSYFIGSEGHFLATTPVTGCPAQGVEAWGEAWVATGPTGWRPIDGNGFKQNSVDYWTDTYAAMTPAEQQAALDTLHVEASSAYDATTSTLDTNALLYGDTRPSNPAVHLLKTLILECTLSNA